MDTMDNDFDFCSDSETAFKKFAKLYFSARHNETCFAGIPRGTTLTEKTMSQEGRAGEDKATALSTLSWGKYIAVSNHIH